MTTGSLAKQQVLPFNRHGNAFRAAAKPIPCRANDCDGTAYPVNTGDHQGYRCTKCGEVKGVYGEKDEC